MKKLSILLIVCILVGMLPLSVIAGDVITEDDNVSLVEPITYSPYTTSWGEVLMVDSEGNIKSDLVVSLNIRVDISLYKDDVSDFFGVDIVSIEQLFADEFVDALVKRIGHVYGYLITISDTITAEQAINILKNNVNVISVRQDFVDDAEPADASVYDDYTASNYSSYELAGVSAAWEYGFVGSDDITVAVLDTGVIVHDEFDNNMNYNLAYNVVGDAPTNDVTPTYVGKEEHGTRVSSIIGADLGDGGVNGICQNVNIIPVKIDGRYSYWYAGFTYAMSVGADVINLSWEFSDMGSIDDDLTRGRDVVVVVAAGNNGADVENISVVAGVRNDEANWIIVGNSTLNDTRWSGSNYSSEYVDIFAPGTQIPVAGFTEPRQVSATSYATPMVAAAAALIMSHAPHLSAVDVVNLLINNDDDASALSNLCDSGGRLAIDKAILALYGDPDRGAYSKGDINGDEIIDQFDYLMCKSAYMGQTTLTAQQADAADVNNDDVVDMFDYLLIQSYINKTAYFSP